MEHLHSYLRWRNINIVLSVLILLVLGFLLIPIALYAPRVVHITPADGTTNANPQAGIQITFSQWVRPASVQNAINFDPPIAFTVVGANFPRPGASVVTVMPSNGLRYNTHYRITLSKSVSNLLGRTLEQTQTLAFATAPYVTVAHFGPQRDANNIALQNPITVEFDTPVVSAEQIAAVAQDPRQAATLPQPLTLNPATDGVGRWLSPTLFGFYPSNQLHAATTYTARLRADITTDGQARLEKPFSWNFTTAAPLLNSVRPYDGALDVPDNSEIDVQLAADVDVTAATQSFTLRRSDNDTLVNGSFQIRASGFRFKPATPLARNTNYEARLDTGIPSSTGKPLNMQPLTWHFTTMGDLEIAQVEPPNKASEVLTDTNRISVRFNHPVVALTTLDAGQVMPLIIEPALEGSGKWLDTSTYIFTPKHGMAPATTYTARITAGLQDQTGGILQQEFRWQWNTITPRVIDSSPLDGAQYASPNDPIVLVFNQPMDLASLNNAIVVKKDGIPIPGNVALGQLPTKTDDWGYPQSDQKAHGFPVAFKPTFPLERGAEFTLTVANGARAAHSNGSLQHDYRLTFHVAPLPRLESSDPVDGASTADPNNNLSLNFSAPMDWASVNQHLTIEPQPSSIITSTSDTSLYVYLSLKPETAYRITIGADARDIYGVALDQATTLSFHTAPLPPSLNMAGVFRLGSYNAYMPARVPVQHVGTSFIDYQLYTLAPEQVADIVSGYTSWNDYRPDASTQIKQGTLNLTGDRNQQRIDLIELGRLNAGMYFLEIRGADGVTDRQMMSVSPYALTMKRSTNQLFIWAVDLASGKPATNLPLSVMSYNFNDGSTSNPSALGHTDNNGILKQPFPSDDSSAPLFLWSPVGERFTFGTTNWGEGITPWDFGLPVDYAPTSLVGSIITDRPIYRPLQNVYLRGVARLEQGEHYARPNQNQSAYLSIADPNGNQVFASTLPLSEFGTFNTSFALDQNAVLGSYSVMVRLDPGENSSSFYGSFNVAEYRKPAFEVAVTPSKPELVQGETLSMNVSARYFAGGALANAPIHWRLLANPLYFAPETASTYSFENIDDAYAWYHWDDSSLTVGGELVADGQAQTDQQGNFQIDLPATLGNDNHNRTLTLDVEVTDVDGQVIAGQADVNIYTGAFQVGVRPAGYLFSAGQAQRVDVITLDLQGAAVANRALSMKMYKREWNSVRQRGADGQLYWTSTFSDTLIDTQAASTDAQGRGSVTFTPSEGGEYHFVASAHDDAGHAIGASSYTWVYGGSDVFWGIDDSNRIDLIADKRSYQPGETAHILVTAPYKDMRALLTIERGSVLEHQLFTLQGTSKLLNIPINANYAPNIYVSVVLIKPAGGELPTPDLRIGIVNLAVSTEQQELNIAITPDHSQAGPHDQVTYSLQATDFNGQGVRAEISLALVDKAVLSLAADANPSLTQAFYTKRPLSVFTSQSLTALVDRVTLKLQAGDKGGGGGALNDDTLLRRDFPDTAYWNPSVITDANGTAQITLTLPDSLTTWRMIANGLTTDTRVGQASNDLIATRPLLIRPTLPRVLTVGDQVVLQAVVQNTTANSIDATAGIVISQVHTDTTATGALISVSEPYSQTVQVPANSSVVVRWMATANNAGQATLRFSIVGGNLQDTTEQVLPVQRFSTPAVVASAGQVLDTTIETIAVPANIIQSSSPITSSHGEFDLEMLPSLAAGINSTLDYLQSYPYLGSEQTISRFLPNVAIYRLFKQLGMNDPTMKTQLENNLSAGLQRLSFLQHSDGGWGWWENDRSDPYLTAYVIQGLIEAKTAGYSIDQAHLNNGISYIQASLADQDSNGRNPISRLNMRAYSLFVLAEAGLPDRGRTITLYDQRDKLDIYARAYVLMTLQRIGNEDERVRVLVANLMSTAILHTTDAHWEEADNDYWNMSSNTRSTALALQALIRSDPHNFLIPNAVRYLIGERDQGRWSSTHESAIVLLALAEYIAQSGELNADYNYNVALDGTQLSTGTINRDNLKNPINVVIALANVKLDGQSQLTLQRQASNGQSGAGRLYYTLRMRYYEDAATALPIDQGIGIQREYSAVDTDTLSPTGQLIRQAPLSALVQVRLTLTVPEDMSYFVVEDILPAGLEALDTSLKTTSAATQSAELNSYSQPDWWYFEHTTIHDNRVALFATRLPKGTYQYTYLARATNVGTFKTLPATAYQMYTPEIFGRSIGDTFTVTAP